jgi:hypothetical protein
MPFYAVALYELIVKKSADFINNAQKLPKKSSEGHFWEASSKPAQL